MLVLIDGVLLFLIAFSVHLFIWKIRLPKNHSKILLAIFLGVLVFGTLFLVYFGRFDLYECMQLGVLFVSMTLAYVTTYSGIEVESPSLRMMLDIAETGPEGCAPQDLFKPFSDDYLVGLRVKDLAKDRMIILDKNKYKLTVKGASLARLFIFYRRLLNAGKGG
jgi:hypothetical protein